MMYTVSERIGRQGEGKRRRGMSREQELNSDSGEGQVRETRNRVGECSEKDGSDKVEMLM